jgi:hypothetical protein
MCWETDASLQTGKPLGHGTCTNFPLEVYTGKLTTGGLMQLPMLRTSLVQLTHHRFFFTKDICVLLPQI